MGVGSLQAAEIAAFADPHAGDEEAHRERLRPGRCARADEEASSIGSAQAATIHGVRVICISW